MSRPMLHARAAPILDEPKPNKAVIAFFKAVSPAYLRLALRFGRVRLINPDRAVDAFNDFQDGRNRLIIAFRHAYGDEPQLMAYAVARALPAEARKLGRPLKKPAHAAFVHGYEVPLWMGPFVRWLLPRAGALPIHHVRFDSAGLSRIRNAALHGEFPLALAPEGQVSYTSESVPRLEQGFARVAFWTAEELEKAGREERTIVLPVSIHYRYGTRGPEILDRILAMIESDCGIQSRPGVSPYERLRSAADAVVGLAERFYAELDGTPTDAARKTLNQRWEAVVEAALRAGERALRLPDDGDATHRFYRIRQAGWDRIYRSGNSWSRPPLFRALADRAAGEAWYAMRHMELADIGYYLDFDALKEDDSVDRYVEAAANYWDLTSRLRGGNISDRLRFFRKDAFLAVGTPLDVGSRLPAYRENRKTALKELTADLDVRFSGCVDDYLKEPLHADR